MQNEYNICIRRLRNWLSHYSKFTCNYKCYSRLYSFLNNLCKKLIRLKLHHLCLSCSIPYRGIATKFIHGLILFFFHLLCCIKLNFFFMFYFILPFELFHILGNKLYYFVKIDAITETVIDDKYVKDNTERYYSSVLSSGKVDDCYFTI